MSNAKSKPIQVIPRDPESSNKIDAFAEQLRTSRAGFVGFALDFFIPLFERGEVQVVNGQIVPANRKAA